MSGWVFGEPGPVRQPPFPGRFGEEDGEEQRGCGRARPIMGLEHRCAQSLVREIPGFFILFF